MENDDSIKMSVGLQNLLSIDFELEHINYNCRGTIKGLITFNYIHIPIKYVEVQLLKKEDIFIDKTKKEPIIIEDIELIKLTKLLTYKPIFYYFEQFFNFYLTTTFFAFVIILFI